MAKYVAFLRGINVSGNKIVPMTKLKTVLEEMGFHNIRTILTSGNIVFEAKKQSLTALTKNIFEKLEASFGFRIPVIIRDAVDILKMIESDPFNRIDATPKTRLYVTFLSENPKNNLKIPYISPDNSFRILSISNDILFSALDLTKTQTPDAMMILEKEFGKNITTRNWNTVLKILKK
jgi:uncharacterized protein (DUF1697 family)